ncbi:uncharacterized protein LOC117903275 isoform X1 [Drosophila subobscura]|uniref:uncharacterized protein LOC117903275 isoform X1 n=1 Tax=Drosophila subobscura TaxID=7241 RepID=UPI00155A5B2C|nr:uncharacterized protein LOC117903275 isoform X1 [Drosophila subobscura]
MENHNVNVAHVQFDWDAINVGDYNLDHSQNFFAAANKENKPLNNGNLILGYTPLAKMANCQPLREVERDTKKIIPLSWDSDSNDATSPTLPKEELQVAKSPTCPTEEQQVAAKPPTSPTQVQPREELISDDEPSPKAEVKVEKEENEVEVGESDAQRIELKLRSQWSPRPESHHHEIAVVPPKAYDFKDIYQHNREVMLRKRDEQERKARQFQSRPMPNFSAMHKRLDDIVVCHRITIPTTPETMKHWQMDLERRKRKEQEKSQLSQIRRQLHPKDVQPSQPFHLRSDQRVRERREYDAAVQASLDKKKKEVNQDEQRKRCEQEEIKEIRKMMVFKARPNPFK